MPRKRYVFRQDKITGEVVCIDISESVSAPKEPSAPEIIQDSIDPLLHPCDGRLYESKSEYRRVTKLHGMVELGDRESFPKGNEYEPPAGLEDSVIKAKTALSQLSHVTDPVERHDRALALMEEYDRR